MRSLKNKIYHIKEQPIFQIFIDCMFIIMYLQKLHFHYVVTCSAKSFSCSIASRLLSSSVFVRCPQWYAYFQILYNTMDFYKWKLNSIWSCKWIIWKRITEHTCWSVGVLLTCHIKFYTCNNSMPKQILAYVGTRECDRTLLIGRPELISPKKRKYSLETNETKILVNQKICGKRLNIGFI